MASRSSKVPYHVELLGDRATMYATYDEYVQHFLDVIRMEGYFDGDMGDIVWPTGSVEQGTIDRESLQRRSDLVNAVYRGLPPLRDERLADAWRELERLIPLYHEGTRLYLRLRNEFVARGTGTERDFLRLYQAVYVDALADAPLLSPDAGEAALVTVHLARVPLSHAQSVAEALSAELDDPALTQHYAMEIDGESVDGTLHDLLREVAKRTLDILGAGELFATRYNTYNNFGVLGSSFWKSFVDADLFRAELAERNDLSRVQNELQLLGDDIRLAHAMTIEFHRAHTEDPSRLKPLGYWYGQEYSYLTRDMIDVAVRIVDRANAIAVQVGVNTRLEMPPLMCGKMIGRFLEYPNVGCVGDFSKAERMVRLARWMRASWRFGRGKIAIERKKLPKQERREQAWQGSLRWGDESLAAFDIDVKVTVDPQFRTIARELDLAHGARKILFLPTHQSLHDHPVLYKVLSSPELVDAMGWERSEPCVILARTGLARAGIKFAGLDITMFGTSSSRFDQLLQDVDEYITLERAAATKHTTTMVVEALEERPGVVYPMATTAAFPGQIFPLQHALFAQLPEDVVIIPIGLRGVHSLWPKCPNGNFYISPGIVEAVILPPMLGETTLMPKRRSLRIQLETAALFQAMQIAALLNPEQVNEPVGSHIVGHAKTHRA